MEALQLSDDKGRRRGGGGEVKTQQAEPGGLEQGGQEFVLQDVTMRRTLTMSMDQFSAE